MLLAPVNAWFSEELRARSWFHRDSATDVKIFSHLGSGGVAVSGNSSALKRNPTFIYAGTGGAIGSGSAVAFRRESILRYTAVGGAAVSGVADARRIAPNIYYINPLTGNDSNSGNSWLAALKTFRPFNSKTILLAEGDQVRIATIGQESTIATVSGRQIQSTDYSALATSLGWDGVFYFTPVTNLFDNVLVVDEMLDNWVFTGNRLAKSTVTTSPYLYNINRWGHLGVQGYTQDEMVAYKPLPATVNLSSWSRLELRFSLNSDGNESPGSKYVLALSLCSDTAGQTELLRIPLNWNQSRAGVFVYEGTLPDNINSLSFRTITQGTMQYQAFNAYSLIATKAITDPNYIGLFTQFKIGATEGNFWQTALGYRLSGTTPQAIFGNAIRGKAIDNNTTMVVYMRKCAGWDLYKGAGPDATLPLPSAQEGTFIWMLRDQDQIYGMGTVPIMEPTFLLPDVQGTVSSPIQISGGWDPVTNQITSRTALTFGKTWIGNADPALCAFVFKNTKYIQFKNIDLYVLNGNLFHIEGDNDNISFENCELVFGPVIQSFSYAPQETGPVNYRSLYTTAPRPTLTNVYFKNCLGSLFLYAYDGSTTLNSFSTFSGLTLDNCVLSPYIGINRMKDQLGFRTPVTLIGDLKVYPVCNKVELTSEAAAPPGGTWYHQMQLPTFASGQTGTVYVYGAGNAFVAPTAADNTIVSQYVFPKFYLQNTLISVASTRFFNRNSISGQAEYVEFPEITVELTSFNWNKRQPTASSQYLFPALFGVAENSPVFHIKKFTHTGAYATNADRMSIVRGRVMDFGGQVSQFDFSTAASSSGYKFFYTPIVTTGHGVHGPTMFVIDGYTSTNSGVGSNTTQTYINDYYINKVATGVFDFRNVTVTIPTNTYSAVPPSIGLFETGAYFIRYKSSSFQFLQDPTASVYQEPTVTNRSNVKIQQSFGFNGGIVLEDCTMTIGASLRGVGNSSTTDISSSTGVLSLMNPLTIINNTTPQHSVYFNPGFYVEKDFAIRSFFDFSWKVVNRVRLASPFSLNIPLASLPVRIGKLVTITIYGRRSTSSAYGGLVVHHNGCGGYATNQALQEYFVPMSAGPGTWELLTCQFVCQESGMIDIAWSHFGVEGSSSWFEFLRLVEV